MITSKIEKSKSSAADILSAAEKEAKEIKSEAEKTAETMKREALLEAKEEALKAKNDFDREKNINRVWHI